MTSKIPIVVAPSLLTVVPKWSGKNECLHVALWLLVAYPKSHPWCTRNKCGCHRSCILRVGYCDGPLTGSVKER